MRTFGLQNGAVAPCLLARDRGDVAARSRGLMHAIKIDPPSSM